MRTISLKLSDKPAPRKEVHKWELLQLLLTFKGFLLILKNVLVAESSLFLSQSSKFVLSR